MPKWPATSVRVDVLRDRGGTSSQPNSTSSSQGATVNRTEAQTVRPLHAPRHDTHSPSLHFRAAACHRRTPNASRSRLGNGTLRAELIRQADLHLHHTPPPAETGADQISLDDRCGTLASTSAISSANQPTVSIVKIDQPEYTEHAEEQKVLSRDRTRDLAIVLSTPKSSFVAIARSSH